MTSQHMEQILEGENTNMTSLYSKSVSTQDPAGKSGAFMKPRSAFGDIGNQTFKTTESIGKDHISKPKPQGEMYVRQNLKDELWSTPTGKLEDLTDIEETDEEDMGFDEQDLDFPPERCHMPLDSHYDYYASVPSPTSYLYSEMIREECDFDESSVQFDSPYDYGNSEWSRMSPASSVDLSFVFTDDSIDERISGLPDSPFLNLNAASP